MIMPAIGWDRPLTASGERLARESAGGNHLYSVAAITDTTGAVARRYAYGAYGQQEVVVDSAPAGLEQAYGFTGRRLDGETGLWYFRARYYDDGLGRFAARDPRGHIDGPGFYPGYFVPNGTDPTGLFRLAYANVSVPPRRIDCPYGPVPQWDAWVIEWILTTDSGIPLLPYAYDDDWVHSPRGLIAQDIYIQGEMTDCKSGQTYPMNSHNYTEFWTVRNGIFPTRDDSWFNQQNLTCSRGEYTMTGRAIFTEDTTDPYSFGAGVYHDRPSEGLPAVYWTGSPAPPSSIGNLSLNNTVIRRMTVRWNCDPGNGQQGKFITTGEGP